MGGSPRGQSGSHLDAGMCLYATEEYRTQVGLCVQLLLHHWHHAEAGLGQGLQALGPQLRHCGAQALWVLLCQHDWHLQQLGHLCSGGATKPCPREELGACTPGLREEGMHPVSEGGRTCTLSIRAATETISAKCVMWRNFSCMSHRNSMDDSGRTRPRQGLTDAMS